MTFAFIASVVEPRKGTAEQPLQAIHCRACNRERVCACVCVRGGGGGWELLCVGVRSCFVSGLGLLSGLGRVLELVMELGFRKAGVEAEAGLRQLDVG